MVMMILEDAATLSRFRIDNQEEEVEPAIFSDNESGLIPRAKWNCALAKAFETVGSILSLADHSRA